MFDFNSQVLTEQDLMMLQIIENSAREKLNKENMDRIAKGLKPKKYTLVEVPLKLCRIDYRYQRDIDEKKIHKLSSPSEYDINKTKVKMASFREGEGIFLMDGQHTALIKYIVGEETIDSKLFFGLTPQEEAEYFAAQLENETKPDMMVRFKAHLFARKQYALDIKNSVDEHGFTLKFPGDSALSGKNIEAVQPLEDAYKKYGGKKAVDIMLDVLIDSGWDKYNESFIRIYLMIGLYTLQIMKYLNEEQYGTAYNAIINAMKLMRPNQFLGAAFTATGVADKGANMHACSSALKGYLKMISGVPQKAKVGKVKKA